MRSKRASRVGALVLAAGLLAAFAPTAHAATIEVTGGFSLVEAEASARCDPPTSGPDTDSDSQQAGAGADFDAGASASASGRDIPEDCGTHASGTAHQRTEISGSGSGLLTVGATGTARGTGSGESREDSDAEGDEFRARSRVAINFEVSGGPAEFVINGSASGLTLTSFFSQALVADPNFRSGRPGGGFSDRYVLQPGSYSLTAEANCTSVTTGTTNCPEARYSFTASIGDATDSDGDALFDRWETDGLDSNGDGTADLDLPAMGAKPNHKDVFLEIDHMPGHGLSDEAIDKVVAAFAAAPVTNPNGAPGITLHVDNGGTSTMDPPTGTQWGVLSDQDVLAHQNVLGTGVGDDYNWSAVDAIKAANFLPARRQVFHYVISGHGYGSASNDSSGISRNLDGFAFGDGASDLLVTLGLAQSGEGSGSVDQQAGTLMHELGHNLSLQHGGADGDNYKPNYLSIMNYSFQFTGLRLTDGTFRFDYSELPISLDEGALDETAGFGFDPASESAQYDTLIACPDLQLFARKLRAGFLDWNCNTLDDGALSADVNGDGQISAFGAFLDWPALVYDGGSIGADGAGVPLAQTSAMIEPQLDELRANEQAVRAGPGASTAPRQDPGGGSGGSGGGTAPGSGPSAGVGDVVAASLRGLRASPSRFAAASRGASIAGRRARVGTTVSYTLSEDATVTFTVERRKAGRVQGGKCRKPSRRNRRARKCDLPLRGSFRHTGKTGRNTLKFTGRLARRKLAPGQYNLVATARDGAGNVSRPGRAKFTIVRR